MKIIKDTISYADNVTISIGGEEIKGFTQASFVDITKSRIEEENPDFVEEWKKSLDSLAVSGEMTFTGTFTQCYSNLPFDDYGLCEFDYIDEDIGLYILDELLCYVDIGVKRGDNTFYFIGLSDRKEGSMYEKE